MEIVDFLQKLHVTNMKKPEQQRSENWETENQSNSQYPQCLKQVETCREIKKAKYIWTPERY